MNRALLKLHMGAEAPLRTSLILLLAISISSTACPPQHVGRARAAAAARRQPRHSGPEGVGATSPQGSGSDSHGAWGRALLDSPHLAIGCDQIVV